MSVYNSTFFGGGWRDVNELGELTPRLFPCHVYNSVILFGNVGLNANTSGQIIEDYNVINCRTPRTNVTTGTNSKGGSTYTYALSA